MSTKIYDAFKMNYNLHQSFNILKGLQHMYRKEEKNVLYSNIFKEVVYILDINKLYGQTFFFDNLEEMKKMNKHRVDYSILGYHLEEYKLARKKDFPTIDDKIHNFSLSLAPIRENETLMKVYFSDNHQKIMFNEFIKKYDIIDYHYQNSTDKPKQVTTKEWE